MLHFLGGKFRTQNWLCLGLLAIGLAAASVAQAGPANPQPIQAAQPDGTKFQAVVRGDEFQGWMETADGYTIVKNASTGVFEYAAQGATGDLIPSGIRVAATGAHQTASPSSMPAKGLRPQRHAALEQYQGQFLNSVFAGRIVGSAGGNAAPGGAWAPAPITGAKKVLTILVNFKDANLSFGSATYWNSAIYGSGGASVNKYFSDNSFGAASIAPVAHTQAGSPPGVVSVSLAQPHPNCGAQCSYVAESAWVNSALAAAAPYVNFAALDTNGDGTIGVDEAVVYFVLAGYETSASAGQSPNVWSHAWGGPGVVVNGKALAHWALSGEMFDDANRMGMGVVAHELGHIGGLPDLYDNSSTNAGLGGFSLMASGSWGRKLGEVPGTTPVALDALSRQYLGWSTPQSPADGTAVSLVSGLVNPGSAVLLMNSALSNSEYWLVENRPPTGWDAGLQNFLQSWTGGLLIQHIDLNAGAQSPNRTLSNFNTYASGSHQGAMAVEPASAWCTLVTPYTTSRGCASLLYHAGTNTNFDSASTPNSNYYSGIASGLGLTGISAPGAVMTATVRREPVTSSTSSAKPIGNGSVAVTAPTGVVSKVAKTSVTGSINVALDANGGVATASSTLAGHPVSTVNNNERMGGNWSNGLSWADATPHAYPDWVQINFNGSYAIDHVVLYTMEDAFASPTEPTDTMTFAQYGITGFTVQTWDGANWVTQATITGNNLVKRTVTFPAVTTDRIRINVTASPDGNSYISEIEAWTTAVPPTPAAPSAPTIGVATAGDTNASVAFTPGALGTGTLVNYTANCGGNTANGASSPILVTGLTNGTSYTCTVLTTSSVGASALSSASNSVTPSAVPGGINVALDANGGVATASSTMAGHPVNTVNNGERTGGNWTNGMSWTDNTSHSYPDWVQINFSGVKTIDHVVLYTMEDAYANAVEPTDTMTFTLYGITGFTVQTWDGTNWVTQATITGNNLVKRTVNFAAVATDRIRINVTASPDGYSYISEIEAFTAGPQTPPSAPTIGTATAGDGSASVAFTPGALGSGTLTNYTANCGGITANGNASPILVTGLTNGTSYTCTVKTTSSVGVSALSAASNTVVPAAAAPVLPSAPTIGTATAGDSNASVAFTPGALGSGTLTNYTANCGGVTATGSSSPILVTGLTNGTSYTCTVLTTSSAGAGAASVASNAVTPTAVPGGINVALDVNGGVATASSTLAGHPVATVNNGERTGGNWSNALSWTDATPHVYPDWVQINFSGVKTIDHVILYTMEDAYASAVEPTDTMTFSLYGITGFTVQTWDGANWVTQATITGNNLVKRTVNFAAVATDRIRINVTASPDGNSYISEIEAFTAGPAVPPSAPTIGTATAGDSNASVAFTPGALGSGTLVNYTASCGGSTAVGNASPILVIGLTNGISYTCTVKTTSSVGTSALSAASNTVVPAPAAPVLPTAPTIGVATAGDTNISVAFTPSAIGSGTLINYTASCGGITATGSSSPILVTGLTNGTSYTCTVKTNSSVGASAFSAASNAVIPSTAPAGINVALDVNGGVATASSTLPGGHPVASVNNGERTGGNYTNGLSWVDATANSGSWVQINFNGVKTIDRVMVYTMQDAYTTPVEPTDTMTFTQWGITGFNVQTWNGTAWVTQATITGNNLVKRTVPFAEVNTDRIRIVHTSSPDGHAYIQEIEAFTAGPATPPAAPTIGIASAGDGNASLTFTQGTLGNGLLLYYTANCNGITATGSGSPILVTGLTNGTSYTCTVQTTSSLGTSAASAASNAVLPGRMPPSAPTIGTATATDRSASVAFTPGTIGNGTLVNYTANCGGFTATGYASPIVVRGLINGMTYTCTVKTTSSMGDSAWSAISNPFIPVPSPGSINVALASQGGIATALSIGNSSLVAYVNDNDRLGEAYGEAPHMWQDNVIPNWVQIQFDGAKTINKIVVYTIQDNNSPWLEPTDTMTFSLHGITDFTVQTWDGTNWVTQAAVTGNNLVKRTVTFSATTTTKIRVVVQGSATTFLSIAEIEAWTVGGAETLPSAPSIGTATPNDASANVNFKPGALGSGSLINYTASCGNFTATGTNSPILVTGLTNGIGYTCNVNATSSIGTSALSTASNMVTPVAASTVSSNVALASKGGVALPSSNRDGYPAKYVNDDVRIGWIDGLNAYWMNDLNVAFPHWVQITFGGVQTISRVVVFVPQDSAYINPNEPTDDMSSSVAMSFDVQTWNGSTWVVQASVSGSNLVKNTVNFPMVTTDRIRVNVNSTTRGIAAISEIQAWTVVGTQPDTPTIGTISQAGGRAISVPFTPTALGSGTLTNYTADCGGMQATGSSSPILVSGLSNVATYNCRVKTTTSLGTSAWSAMSNAVTIIPVAGTPPSAPAIGTAIAGNTSASVSFTPGALGTGTLTNYTADCGGMQVTGMSSPIVVTGLTNGTGYTCKVMTTSSAGYSAWSGPSNLVTPIVSSTLPSAPTIGVAKAGDSIASVRFTPGSIGTGTLVYYTANCGGNTANGLSSPITVTGLSNGTDYTCMVQVVSSVGAGAWSAASNTVTPSAAYASGNVALASQGGVATASFTQSAFSPAYVNDNERVGLVNGVQTQWRNQNLQGNSDWVQIAFNGIKTIDRVVVYSPQNFLSALNSAEPSDTMIFSSLDEGVVNFSVQTRNGTDWVTQATITGNDLVKRTVTFPAVDTDGIRLVVTYTSSAYPSIRLVELQAWTAPSPTPPTAPVIGSAVAGIGSAIVTFAPATAMGSGTFVNYMVDCVDVNDGSRLGVTAMGTGSPITVPNLINGLTYTCKVLTVSSVGVSNWSDVSNTITPNTIGTLPSIPNGISAVAGDTSIKVLFTPGALGSGSFVNHTADCGGIAATGSSSPINVTGLTNGTSYTCRVSTTTTAGTSPWAQANAVTPVAGPPAAPTNVIPTAGNGSASVAFTPGALISGTLTGYTADCGGVTATGQSSPINVTGLNNGIAYLCKVKATSSIGIGPWSDLSNPVTPAASVTLPAAPVISNVAAANLSARLSFTPGALGSGTLVAYNADCGGMAATDTVSPLVVTGLTNNTTYTCKVQTVSTAGPGPWSAQSAGVTPQGTGTPPMPPTGVIAVAGEASATVTFTPGVQGSGSLVSYTANCGGVTASATSATTITVIGLVNSSSYTCKVRTTTSDGVSAWSAQSAEFTPTEAPVTYFHNDISGSPMLATDASGKVVWKENYRPYGERLNNQAGSDSNNKIWFAGKPFDAGTGLTYMGARYYDPVIGRFMGVDPAPVNPGNVHAFNRYAYANNNPYKFVDPDGHSPIDVAFLVYDLGKLGLAVYSGVGVGAAFVDVGLSVIGVASPIPGTGQVLKSLRVVEHVAVAGRAAENIYTGSKLAKNMAEAGNAVAKGTEEAHHIVAQGAAAAEPARKVLKQHGIDIHSAENGAAMAKNSHQSTHTQEYYDGVNRTVENANRGPNAAQQVRDALDTLRQQLQSR